MKQDEQNLTEKESRVAPSRERGVVVSHFGVAVEVLLDQGGRRMVRVKRNSGHVVGDRVLLADEVLTRLSRDTELRRRDIRGGVHLVAANLDILGVVVAPMSPAGFIDRAVISARAAGLRPFLVVNKGDLPETAFLAVQMQANYRDSFPVFVISAATGAGMEPLREFLHQGHRGAFVGSTGVGKSSLLNALCPEINLKVGSVSDYKQLGRHTTTVATLHSIPGGGELVDTPGFRDFGLVDVTPEEVALHFPGFEKLDHQGCRFHNCRHRQEPGCAIIDLVEGKGVSADRYRTYLAVLGEAELVEAALLRRPRRG